MSHDEEARLITEMDRAALAGDTEDRRMLSRAVAVSLRTGRDTRAALDGLKKRVDGLPAAVVAAQRDASIAGGGGLTSRLLRLIGTREGLAACAVIGPLLVASLSQGCNGRNDLTPAQRDAIVAAVEAIQDAPGD